MGIIDNIKKEATDKKINIQDSSAQELQKLLNNTFYLDKNIEEETKFVKQVMTRGLDTQERTGLHASAMLAGEKDFCLRAQVLSLIYKQSQGEQINPGLMRIFEQGNAIHEKWQRLFIRANYGKAIDMDYTRFCEEYKLSYTPDIDCYIPEFFEGRMIGEIKSVNTFQYQRMQKHPSAWKQCQFYMYLCIKELKNKKKWNGVDYTKGFVLSEDKNNQDFKIEVYDYNPVSIENYIERAEEIKFYYNRVFEKHKMVQRPKDTNNDCESKRCKDCFMRNACYNINGGKIKIEDK